MDRTPRDEEWRTLARALALLDWVREEHPHPATRAMGEQVQRELSRLMRAWETEALGAGEDTPSPGSARVLEQLFEAVRTVLGCCYEMATDRLRREIAAQDEALLKVWRQYADWKRAEALDGS
jgi:hypothetical protein